jgi:hypothetical protein
MMMSGWMVLGALLCVLGTIALVAITVVALRWFLDQGRAGSPPPASFVAGRAPERLD